MAPRVKDVDDQLPLDMHIDAWTQRWNEGRGRWTHTRLGGFDPKRYWVAPIEQSAAKAFVEQHHYLKMYPTTDTRNRFGLFDRGRWDELVGVAMLGNPSGDKVLPAAFPNLVAYKESLELKRFVLHQNVPANGETWFLAQAFDLARQAGIRGVIAFSNPWEEQDTFGNTVFPGHLGHIYISSNAIYTGMSRPSDIYRLPNGRDFHVRNLTKIRNHEQGWKGAAERLIECGAPRYLLNEDMGFWVLNSLAAIHAVKARVGGKHRYLMPIGWDRQTKRMSSEQWQRLGLGYKPQPKPTMALGPVVIGQPVRAKVKPLETIEMF